MASKEETIAKVYHDPVGFGSIKATLKDARAHDNTINEEDVRRWIRTKEIGLTKKPRGMNSFIVSGPREEYQMDLLFFPEAPVETKNSAAHGRHLFEVHPSGNDRQQTDSRRCCRYHGSDG
eukprot:15807245-Heterocapsa_arctica.AAC.1